MKTVSIWALWAGLLVAACGGASSGGSSNSETHFLGLCSANDCEDGLSCICGVCTVTCDPAASCGALNPNAICAAPSSSSCGDDTQPSVCDVDCDDNRDCASLGPDFRCGEGVCRPPGCVHDGRIYAEGSTFKVECNTCSCGPGGRIACTRIGCDAGCEHDGVSYPIGAEFPASDGCNTCTCTDYGVACTDEACHGCRVGDRFYEYGETYLAEDGCNTCFCAEDGGGCTQRACSSPECLLPFDAGECLAFMPVYHYNPETFRCEERVYGGCGGNDNRFDSLEACQARCPEIEE